MSPSTKQLHADWRRLAKVIGPGRQPTRQEMELRYRTVMQRVALGRDPYPSRRNDS